MTTLFNQHTREDAQRVLADFMPNGKAWTAKNVPITNLYKLLYGMSGEALRIEELMNLISEDYGINETVHLLPEWEKAVGIPDHCLSTNVSIEQRRKQVLFKLAMRADTRESFIAIANFFGFECEISNASPALYPFPMLYPWPYDSYLWASCTLYIDLPISAEPEVYPFSTQLYPWPYSNNAQNIIECIFEEIKNAACQLIFRYIL